MIVVKVELHKGGIGGEIVNLARMHIINDGTGHETCGSYIVNVLYGRGKQLTEKSSITRKGVVLNYPRLSLHVFNLVARALAACGYK